MPNLSRRFGLGVSVLVLSVVAAKAPANAQTFPSNVIRIVVSATPGTPPDIVSRLVANELVQSEGWRIVVENRPGAMQTIAGSDVLKQPADGLTIMSVSLPSAVAPSLLPALNYRLDTEFAPVIKLMTANHVLVVNPSVPARSLADWSRCSRASLTSCSSRPGASARRRTSLARPSSCRQACGQPTFPTARCPKRLAICSTAPTIINS